MASQHTVAAIDLATHHVSPRLRSGALRVIGDYWALTKPEVNFLILITTFAGFYLASTLGPDGILIFPIIRTVLGTLLVASGADARMRRTARRPVASGRIEPGRARAFGILLSLAGVAYLLAATRPLAALLATFTWLGYLFLYTPAKRRTPLCTLIGAVPGAMPPLIGWAAARGRLDAEAWMLFAVLFFWQFPHFMAIAWMYREDYTRAGYLVLPLGEQRDRFVIWQSLAVSLALIPLSLIPTIIGESGLIYSIGALILGSIFAYYSGRFAFRRSNAAARQLLAASIVYLPAVFTLMVLNKK